MIRFLLMIAFAITAAGLSALDARAGASFDRPDILGADHSSSTNSGAGTSDSLFYRASASIAASTSGAMVSGYGVATVSDGSDRVRIRTRIYQPDKQKRTKKKASTSQKRFLFISVSHYDLASSTQVASQYGYIEGCRAKVKATDKDKDGNFDIRPDKLTYSFKCKKDVLEELNFTPGEITAIQALIGTSVKLKIKLD